MFFSQVFALALFLEVRCDHTTELLFHAAMPNVHICLLMSPFFTIVDIEFDEHP